MGKVALIVAGGKGVRMDSKTPKQFLLLKNLPILMHTINKFVGLDDIFLVLPANQFNYWKELCEKYHFQIKHNLISGGRNRFESVRNGLKKINNANIVAIHDGVRPLVSKNLIRLLINGVKHNYGAIPVLPIKDSLRKITSQNTVSLNRKETYYVQTPQCFRVDDIKKAYEQRFLTKFTDDASVYESFGGKIKTILGEEKNIKITSKTDLKIAEFLG
jgi:2-C-methyl-D-erythritol 4-phosphate cytidylyltransferase